jgi:hypothetical protein
VPSSLILFAYNSQKEKKNLQDSAGVYVYNVGDREELDRPTAKLIKDFSSIEGNTHYMNCSLVTHGQSLRDMRAQLFSVECGSWIIFLAKVIYHPVESLISFGCSDVIFVIQVSLFGSLLFFPCH